MECSGALELRGRECSRLPVEWVELGYATLSIGVSILISALASQQGSLYLSNDLSVSKHCTAQHCTR